MGKYSAVIMAALLIGLALGTASCQSTASSITVENRTTADVILVASHAFGTSRHLVPACGRTTFDPKLKATDSDLSSTNPEAVVLTYDIGMVADAPTVATVVITSAGVEATHGPPPSLPACAGAPPAVAPTGQP